MSPTSNPTHIPGIPAVRLKTLMPRRVFVPLERVRGKQTELLWKTIGKGVPLAVYWQHSRLDKEGKEQTNWSKAFPLMDNRLPSCLWKDSYFEWEFDQSDERQLVEHDPPDDTLFPIDISLVVAGPDKNECGLSIAWNPFWDNVKRTCLLVTERAPDIDKLKDTFLCEHRFIHLQIKKIAILPIEDLNQVPDTPPDIGDLLTSVIGLVKIKDKRWQMRPTKPTCFYLQTADHQSRDKAVVSVDFGTSSSTISILNTKSKTSKVSHDVGMITDLCPWTHTTVFPLHDSDPISPGHIASETKMHNGCDLWKGTIPPVPDHVREHRLAWSPQKTARVSSLLYTLPESADEKVTVHVEDAIGHEADEALAANLTSNTPEWKRFQFSPKKRLGADPQLIERDKHPIELYLRELFDQAMHTRLLESPYSVMAPVDKIAYSYPVTWTRSQRDQYRKHLEKAVEQSFISELTNLTRGSSLFDDSYAMDEASAAFLGFLLERFNGLEGDEVVDIFQPFSPTVEEPEAYPKKIHVLVFDSGEGTTDLVLLEITDAGDQTKPVDSRVIHHFALEKAGLEVTRRIAEHLKEYLKQANPDCYDILRTNLFDVGLDEYQKGIPPRPGTTTRQNKETYRRTLIHRIMQEAERIKVKMKSEDSCPIVWRSILSLTGLNSPSKQEFTRDELVKIVADVYSPPIGIIRRWLVQSDIKLDVILMSGRSCQLPGLKKLIEDHLPKTSRPFQIDFVEPGCFHLQRQERNCDESSKTSVCKGLAMNFWNLSAHNRRALKCHPIDEKLRVRAIGILKMGIALQPLPSFDERYELLVDSDNAPVKPEEDLPPIISYSPTSRGFYLGINFSGRPPSGQSECVGDYDAPQPFCHVLIENGHEDAYKELRFIFRHTSATEVRLARVEMQKENENIPSKSLPVKSEINACVEIGGLRITLAPYRIDEDSRVTGRIHIDGQDPLDHDQ